MRRLARISVAAVWLYNGLWCKLLRGCLHHRDVASAMPALLAGAGDRLLAFVGVAEVMLAVWVVSGRRPVAAAAAQTFLLVAMNVVALVWSRSIPDLSAPERLVSPWRGGRLDGRPGPASLWRARPWTDAEADCESAGNRAGTSEAPSCPDSDS